MLYRRTGNYNRTRIGWRVVALCLVAFAAGLIAGAAFAQVLPVTITATSTSPISPATVTITWSATGATSCTASGAWTGAKAVAGTQVLTGVAAGDKVYTLSCGGATASATLSWTEPVLNTDGTALTDLANYEIFRAPTAAGLPAATPLVVAAPASSFIFTGLPVSTQFFALKAVNSNSIRSDMSLNVSKNITATTGTGSATISIFTKPVPPTVITVASEAWNSKPDYDRLAFVKVKVVGTVQLGLPCDVTRPIADGYYAVPRTSVTWTGQSRPNKPVALCAPGEI